MPDNDPSGFAATCELVDDGRDPEVLAPAPERDGLTPLEREQLQRDFTLLASHTAAGQRLERAQSAAVAAGWHAAKTAQLAVRCWNDRAESERGTFATGLDAITKQHDA